MLTRRAKAYSSCRSVA